jgi:hypothetical protein
MPVERGIAKALGLTDLHYEVEGKTKEQILVEEADWSPITLTSSTLSTSTSRVLTSQAMMETLRLR